MVIELWLIWALLSASFAAMMTIFAKVGLKSVNPDVAQLVRTFVVVALIAPPLLTSGKWREAMEWSAKTWWFVVLSGVATCASWICYFRALDAGDAARVAAVDKLSVVLVAVFAVLVLREQLSLPGWCGVGLVACGLIILTLAK